MADCSAIFVHAGAGYHSQQNESQHLKACANACKAAMAILRNGGSCVDGVEMALRSLEDNDITNAGFGSNLSLDGTVECDASIVDESGWSGAVGAVDSFKNPSALARLILDNSRHAMSLKRVPPVLVAGPGAKMYAAQYNFPIIKNEDLISVTAHQRWLKWKRELDNARPPSSINKIRLRPTRRGSGGSGSNQTPSSIKADNVDVEEAIDDDEDFVTDTVGAICVDRHGRIAAGSSSGGIGMKFRGRVGPAALVGIGTWINAKDGTVVATTCSGTGEQMAHTMIASKAVDRMLETDDELTGLQTCIDKDFMGASVVKNSSMTSAVGIMGIKFEKSALPTRIHFVYGHTTDSMALSHMSASMKEPISTMSRNKRNPKSCMGGTVVRVGPT
ncbi:nucleophile aminohydrolase [Geopyxis carbonaria]|nr:nucleophile aminohydrolase [Geopyxis carbonaria]